MPTFAGALSHGKPSTAPRKGAALITGAAAGLGASFATILAREGFDVILVDRQAERLASRAAELVDRYDVKAHVVVQDLFDPAGPSNIFSACDALGWPVDILVNNAGHHLNKFLHQLPWKAVEDNLQLLLKVVVQLSHLFLPPMMARGWGRVVNVASVSGFMPGAHMLATYTSAKAFLIPFSEALNFELDGTGVRVTALCPGFIKTDLFVNSGLTNVRDSVPWFMWLEPDRVAEEGVRSALKGVPVHVSGLPNRLVVAAAKFLPRALLRERTAIFHRNARKQTPSLISGKGPARKGAALVTGATAGIGASFTEVLARDGFDIILVARREHVLKERAAHLAQRYGVRTHWITLDLTDPQAPAALRAQCEALGWPVDVLVNNAGHPVTELFHQMSWPTVDGTLQILVQSVVHLSHIFIPAMIERGWGRVINVASMAGFEPGSYRSSLYASSKAFVIAFTESVNAELDGTGVQATALCPGFTRTEWTERNKLKNSSVPDLFWMDSDQVADEGFRAAQRGASVSVVGTPALRAVSLLFRMSPRKVVGRVLSNKRKRMAV
jgi:short-subunit dehydrogenase